LKPGKPPGIPERKVTEEAANRLNTPAESRCREDRHGKRNWQTDWEGWTLVVLAQGYGIPLIGPHDFVYFGQWGI
jgi:hypothetical protein